ncbi:hypothetical protein BMS3Abin15_00435 [bacterium BMS3Abin15]|nr:hypothetical protein BMS3Abin15_00435 [bacterium BMS3Abin15]HDZ85049.1 hypothetical protein [Candidatus Moranbacteria bacterium]
MEKIVDINPYLEGETKKTIELMIAEKTDKKSLPNDKSFFVSTKKEEGCIAETEYKGKMFYLHQKF